MQDEADFAWACGLFEGEGCVVNRGYARGRNRGLELCTTDLDVLERFASIVEVGRIGNRPTKAGVNKPLWKWAVTRWCDTGPLARRMLPYMGIRRRAAIEALLATAPRYHANARLTDEQVADLRERVRAGEGHRVLAEEFGISQPYCTRLANGERRATAASWRAETSR